MPAQSFSTLKFEFQMKRICQFALLVWAIFQFAACQNQTSASANETKTETTANANSSDSPAQTDPQQVGMFGIRGSEKPAVKQISPSENEYTYQKYIVRTSTTAGKVGETIAVTPVGGTGDTYLIANGDAYVFAGIWGKYLFVDNGTGPSRRQLIVFDLEKRKPDHAVFVVETEVIDAMGKLWYWKTAAVETIEKKPDCPEKEQWEKEGLQVQYGQREIFICTSGAVIGKSEFKCFPAQ